MAYYNTILNLITAIIPRHELDSLAEQHHSGQKLFWEIYKTAVSTYTKSRLSSFTIFFRHNSAFTIGESSRKTRHKKHSYNAT